MRHRAGLHLNIPAPGSYLMKRHEMEMVHREHTRLLSWASEDPKMHTTQTAISRNSHAGMLKRQGQLTSISSWRLPLFEGVPSSPGQCGQAGQIVGAGAPCPVAQYATCSSAEMAWSLEQLATLRTTVVWSVEMSSVLGRTGRTKRGLLLQPLLLHQCLPLLTRTAWGS